MLRNGNLLRMQLATMRPRRNRSKLRIATRRILTKQFWGTILGVLLRGWLFRKFAVFQDLYVFYINREITIFMYLIENLNGFMVLIIIYGSFVVQ